MPATILGASARLPGSPTLQAFRDLLTEGVCAVGRIGPDRFAPARYWHPKRGLRGKTYTLDAALVDDLWAVDADLYGLSPREAAQLDPQQRLLLGVSWAALEDAEAPIRDLEPGRIGVYVGASAIDFAQLPVVEPHFADAYFMTGSALSILANRVSNALGAEGPSLTVDTACSSSLHALAQATAALEADRIDLAVVAGVNMLLTPYPFMGFSQAQMLSPTGRCRAFGAGADGYVRGEGAAALVLAKAGAFEDRARGRVLSVALSSDGRKPGISAPRGAGQERVLRAALAAAEIEADALAFVEAHGTGTAVGDPIEAGALGRAFGQARSAPLPIGSVKSNIGHLEPASGLAGLLKALLALESGEVPRTLFAEKLNPEIDFDGLNLRVAQAPVALDFGSGDRRIAGVNSFGFGGTNAHVVVEALSPAPQASTADEAPGARFLTLTAPSAARLRDLARATAEQLASGDATAAARLAGAVMRRRPALSVRATAPLGADGAEVAARLITAAETPRDAPSGVVDRPLAFVFSGNGAQWAGMGRAALAADPAFAERFAEVSHVLAPEVGFEPRAMLAAPDLAEQLRATSVAQPLLFALQTAAADRLVEIGLRPSVCFGHSVGEIAAAYAAGALTLAAAARLVAARSRLQEAARGLGGMAVIGAGAEEAAAALAAEELHALDIAGVNSGRNVTVAGVEADLEALKALAKRRRWVYRRLDLDYPFHSRLLDPFEAEFRASLKGATGAEPEPAAARFLSTVTGDYARPETLDACYWWRNLRDPVRFADAARRAVRDGVAVTLEIGPRPQLKGYLRDAFAAEGVDGAVATSFEGPNAETDAAAPADALAAAAAAALSAGAAHAADVVYGEDPIGRAPAPSVLARAARATPPDEAVGGALARLAAAHPLLGWRTGADALTHEADLDPEVQPFLADHVVAGRVLFPAAGFVEIMLAAAAAALEVTSAELRDLHIVSALTLEAGRPMRVRTRVSDDLRSVRVDARPYDDPEAEWTRHAHGRVAPALPTTEPPAACDGAAETAWTGAALYEIARARGLEYGAGFALADGVERLGAGRYRVRLATGRAPVGATLGPAGGAEAFRLHPAVLDAAFHGAFAVLAEAGAAGDPALPYVPVLIGAARLGAGGAPTTAELTVRSATEYALVADVALFDASGAAAGVLEGVRFRASAFAPLRAPLDLVLQTRVSQVAGADAAPAFAAFAPSTALEQAAQAATPAASDGWALLESAALRAAVDAATEPDAPAHPTLQARRRALAIALEEAGLAQCDASGAATATEAAADLPEARALIEAALREDPSAAAAAALLARAVDDAAGLAAGAPAEGLLEQALTDAPEAVARRAAARAMMGAALAAAPTDRPLRIALAGVGAAWAAEPALRAAAARGAFAETVVAAETPRLAGAAEARFADWPRVSCQSAEAAWAAGGFDLIVDLGCAPRPSAPADLARALAPGGVAVGAAAGPSFFADVTLGAAEGWFTGPASWPESPLVAAEAARAQWRAAGVPAETVETAAGVLFAAQSEAVAPDAARAPGWRAIGDPEVRPVWLAAEGGAGAVSIEVLPARVSPDAGPSASLAPIGAAVASWLTAPDRAVRTLAIVLDASDAGAAETAALAALARTAANEYPDDRVLALSACDAAEFESGLVDTLRASAEHRTGPVGGVRREITPAAPRPRPATPGDARRLDLPRRGRLDGLAWRPVPRRAPGPGEVEIEITAAGLNFRDVMWALNLLPEEALESGFSGPTLGFEASGVAARVGPDVTGVAPGDSVAAVGPHLMASHATLPAAALLPLGGSAARAEDLPGVAARPVAELTARYALLDRARLSSGEWVLIHGAAGGVGLAAIGVAQEVGARVIATAGAPEKQALLRALGVEVVTSSREGAYAAAVRAATNGRGVDVALNSLAGREMERTLGLLAPFGRFCELGKRDFFEDNDLGLRAFRMNLSYFGIDVDQILARPEAARALSELGAALTAGASGPRAHRLLPATAAEDAFRAMQRAEHVGKLVIAPPRAEDAVPTPASSGRWEIAPDEAHLVVGGTGGFGLATAVWLHSRGARRFCLISRRGLSSPEAEAEVAALRGAGAVVEVVAADAATPEGLKAALSAARALGPLTSVIHAATVFDDRLLSEQTAESFGASLRAKADVAAALDRETASDPIARFVLFSSATTAFGNPGQANYVAANGYLEGLAAARRRRGAPALAPLWGAIGDTGVLTRNAAAAAQLQARLGEAVVSAAEALDALEAYALDVDDGAPDSASPIIGRFDWARAFRELPWLAAAEFDRLGAQHRQVEASEGADLTRRIAEVGIDVATAELVGQLRSALAGVLRRPADDLPAERSLSELGVDSLMAVELRADLEARQGLKIPISMMTPNVTLAGLAAQLARRAEAGDAAADGDAAMAAAVLERYTDAGDGAEMLQAIDDASQRAAE